MVWTRESIQMCQYVKRDRKATITQTIPYNQGKQKTICAVAEDHTWCHFCQLKTGNWGYNLQSYQNWTTEDWKTLSGQKVSSDGNRSDPPWIQIEQSCFVVQVGSVVTAWGMFSWYTLDLTTRWALFKHGSLCEYCCWPCVPTVCAMLQSSNHPRLVLYTKASACQSNRAPLGRATKKSAASVWCCHINMNQMCTTVRSNRGKRYTGNVKQTRAQDWT